MSICWFPTLPGGNLMVAHSLPCMYVPSAMSSHDRISAACSCVGGCLVSMACRRHNSTTASQALTQSCRLGIMRCGLQPRAMALQQPYEPQSLVHRDAAPGRSWHFITASLARQVGDTLQLRGFDGEFTPQSGDRPVLMLAGGIGASSEPPLCPRSRCSMTCCASARADVLVRQRLGPLLGCTGNSAPLPRRPGRDSGVSFMQYSTPCRPSSPVGILDGCPAVSADSTLASRVR